MLLLSCIPLSLQFSTVFSEASPPAKGQNILRLLLAVQVPGSRCLTAAKQNQQGLKSASHFCRKTWISIFYFAAYFQGLCKNLKTLTLPSELVKTDQQIQKLLGTDGQHAHKSVFSI